MQDGECVGEEGVSAQPSSSFRAHLLQSAKGCGKACGYLGALKCEYDEDLYHGNGGNSPQADRKIGAFAMLKRKHHIIAIMW